MMRSMLFYAVVLLCLSQQAAAAVKPCAVLQTEIEAKLTAHDVKNYELTVADKGVAATGKVVGVCEGGLKRIIYLRKRNDLHVPVNEATNATASAQTQQPVVKQSVLPSEPAIAPVIPPAPITAPPEPLTDDVPVVEVQMIEAPKTSSTAIKSCAELKEEIAVKLAAKGVKAYELIVSDRNAPSVGKVVGICENNSKKITYSKK